MNSIGRPFFLWTLLLMATSLTCLAQHGKGQHGKGLPDSVSTSVDEVEQTPAPSESESIVVAPAVDSIRRDSMEQQTAEADTPVFRQVPSTVITRYKKDKDFAYANDPAYWKKDPPPSADQEWSLRYFLYKLFSYPLARMIIYILVGALLVWGLYKIVTENKLHLFYKAPRKLSNGAGDGGDLTDLGEEDLEEKIRLAIQAKDHKLSTRYLFLKTLRLLDQRELIRYHAQSTNQEYLQQMTPQPQAKEFRFLLGAYEHVWYGDFPLDEGQFERLVNYFRDFYKTIGS